ncbi:FAD-dependent monooxygenase [Paracoccus sp. S1E-3]|uniref:FAD-dependent oxidoreductase n=1 Tax=Paracoccus sp. S1E-3 TaxID=2756130 RepID=UPI0015EF3CC7|nr:FAD-dependent monooxygenase [Paracoccus sp. S1E-3]MBA4489810.1 FAD-dependent monooxygenase [Paracoccus sp. S1E-3]
MATQINTDVLIVGAGPAGLASSALLSMYGIENLVINKYGWLANTPRAHITNQGTMQVLRDLGVEDRAMALASKQKLMANNVFCHSLAGEEFGRVLSWGNHPARRADYELASPTEICDIPQTYLEPLLLEAAASKGGKIRFNTEYLSLDQDQDGVTAHVRDRLSGEEFTIRSKYMIGADGARSLVAEQLGLPMTGEMGLSGSMNILFDADLSKYVAHRPSVLYWILQPGARTGGIGAGVVRMVRPWNEWLVIWGYDISQGEMTLTEDEAVKIVHQLIGDDTIPVKIRSTSTWTVNNMWATEFSKGRVFCMGDAVHRHPPLNGLGSNTSIQDAYNLAWKLALVLKGQADAALLDSYSAERVPVAETIVTRANNSIKDYPPIFDALGMTASDDPARVGALMAARKGSDDAAKAQRRALNDAIRRKNYEFNTHGVELGTRYASAAVVPDGTPEPEYTRDAELYYHPTTWPGARLPHVWLDHGGKRISSIDLGGKGRFVLLTGPGGEGWRNAAAALADRLGIALPVISIGPDGSDAHDIYADWYYQCGIQDDGAILVRPDNYVAWRSDRLAADPQIALAAALMQVLARRDEARSVSAA